MTKTDSNNGMVILKHQPFIKPVLTGTLKHTMPEPRTEHNQPKAQKVQSSLTLNFLLPLALWGLHQKILPTMGVVAKCRLKEIHDAELISCGRARSFGLRTKWV
eukprot:GHVL01006139.1.p3 GENE.GHVL01006139.1~~GHVL01006139.1.p3  ORF type:complete len:104 (+),score=7.42 GHVL01006139.1:815-1126(+)